MNTTIRWSPRAVSEMENYLEFLNEEWGPKLSAKFLNRVETVLKIISENPALYPILDSDRNIHRSVLTSQIVLYYRIRGKKVELITFWDTRQNPENLAI